MRKNILIQLDNFGNACDYNRVIGINGENLQGKLSFILDTPIKGAGYIEVLHDEVAELIPAETDDYHTYYIDIKNNLLKYSKFYFQLRINENSETNYPVFKSAMLTGYVGDAINASEIIPDPYPDWISKADAQLEKYKKQEEKREANEKQRNENENIRKENENIRITNEKARETYINNLKQSVDNGVFNGADFNYKWDGTKLGVKNSKETEYEYTDLKGEQGEKGDTYELSEEDLQRIAEQITSNANSAFNQNVKEKTDSFNTNANSKTEAYNTNATEKSNTYNSNHTAKLKEYNDNASSKLSAYNANAVTKNTEYNSNHTTKLNAYNTNADARFEEYNTNADNKIAEYDEHSKELNNKIVSTRNELERLKSNVLNTGEDTDTFIHLEDSAMAELQEIKVDGVCEQNTTTGKNLLNVPKYLQQIKNDSYSITPVYSNGMLKYIKLNGTFNAWKAYNILGAKFTLSPGTYVQSFHKEGTFSNGSVYIDSSLSITSIESDNHNKVLSDDLNVSKYKICVNKGTICNNLKLYPMIAKESEASNYEPFTNGASPNPDYPQEIKTITDSLKITSCGKNLFSVNIPVTTQGGITVSQDENGIHVQGTSTNIVNFLFPTKILNRLAGKTITLTCADLANSNIQNISFKSPATNTVYCAIDQNVKSRTYKLPVKIADDTVFSIYILSNMTINSTLKIQVKIGNKSEYENYVESLIEANLPEGEFIGKIDDIYKDTLRAKYFPKEGQYHWMLDKKIGKYVLNGSERWTIDNYASTNYYRYSTNIPNLTSSVSKGVQAMNSHFKQRIYENHGGYEYLYVQSSENSGVIYIQSQKWVSVNELKTWLASNNVEVYYALETPYTLDLDVIDMPLSYNEVTNIFTDSDLLPKINAKYYRIFEKTIQNAQINEKTLKQEITDLNATISDLDTRLKALEAKTVEEPTESEETV